MFCSYHINGAKTDVRKELRIDCRVLLGLAKKLTRRHIYVLYIICNLLNMKAMTIRK